MNHGHIIENEEEYKCRKAQLKLDIPYKDHRVWIIKYANVKKINNYRLGKKERGIFKCITYIIDIFPLNSNLIRKKVYMWK